ncbi:integrase [Gossypium australe]|uniref:Integrase n=1 Tax=Gossypium australe TaxID=47621 RepID=A0A5B6X208_9ROSI|nr:integrase [Gossypium australe]
MNRDLRNLFWWPRMKNEISKFIMKCLTCQRVKAEHQVPFGKLMDVGHDHDGFFLRLPISAYKKNVVWVIVDRLTKSAHFVVVQTNYSLEKLFSCMVYLLQLCLTEILDSCRGSRNRYRHLLEPSFGSVPLFIHKLMDN